MLKNILQQMFRNEYDFENYEYNDPNLNSLEGLDHKFVYDRSTGHHILYLETGEYQSIFNIPWYEPTTIVPKNINKKFILKKILENYYSIYFNFKKYGILPSKVEKESLNFNETLPHSTECRFHIY